jgi:hypothetical protein
MTLTPSGRGTVLPGSPDAEPLSGTVTVAIESAPGENDGIEGAVSESKMARCVYPDGYVKNHQVNTPQDLADKVIAQIRGRYGNAGDITVTKLPAAIEAGETLTLEV